MLGLQRFGDSGWPSFECVLWHPAEKWVSLCSFPDLLACHWQHLKFWRLHICASDTYSVPVWVKGSLERSSTLPCAMVARNSKCHSDSLIGVIRQTFEHPSSSITSAYWAIISSFSSVVVKTSRELYVFTIFIKSKSLDWTPYVRLWGKKVCRSLIGLVQPFPIANLSGMNFCLCCTYCSKTDELCVFNQVGWRSNDLYMR